MVCVGNDGRKRPYVLIGLDKDERLAEYRRRSEVGVGIEYVLGHLFAHRFIDNIKS